MAETVKENDKLDYDDHDDSFEFDKDKGVSHRNNAKNEDDDYKFKDSKKNTFLSDYRKSAGKTSYKSYKSNNMNKTNKTTKFQTSKNFNKNNPAYIYMKEIERNAILMKKRTQTARLPNIKLKISDITPMTTSGYKKSPYKSSQKILQETHQKMINEMINPKNPYSAYWSNCILEKRYNMEFGVNGFLNGVPVITIQKKKVNLNLAKLKEENEDIEDEEKYPDDQFNTNQKNFFKVRKDIAEGKLYSFIEYITKAVEKEEEDEEDNKEKDVKTQIEYGIIYKYFGEKNAKKD